MLFLVCVCMKDVHTELIQHRRLWMLKRGIVKGNLTVDSNAQRLNGSCPLMPEEVNIGKIILVFSIIVSYSGCLQQRNKYDGLWLIIFY